MRGDILSDIGKQARASIGPEKGRLLYFLATMVKARSALELGTESGYSGTWLARAVKQTAGRLTTVEVREERARRARDNFERAKLTEVVSVVVGEASEILPKLDGLFDLIFLDIDKREYVELFEECIRLLDDNGILVADNSSMVRDYNELALNDPRLETVILPVGDGFTVSIKRDGSDPKKPREGIK